MTLAALHHWVHLSLPHQRLHHGDVELAGGLGFASTDATDRLRSDIQKGVEPLLPFAQQRRPMLQHQGVDPAARQDRCCHNRFPESRRCLQHADVMAQHRFDGGLLVSAQLARERQLQQ